ncbi:MAG: InlB B-repeat-containing protein, partial [Bifidobacteriaceae bacterium]|nr:InlB B-repeat-containing protein [Bifidobacteriaceae bacterium]
MINTQAIKSKARRPGAALVALALAGTLGLLATQSAQAEDTTPTADTYTVTFLNGDGATTAFQRSATAGVVVPKPSLIQLELAGFTYPDNKYFENTWTYVSNGQEVDFANDTVDSDLTLAPILYDGVTISFSTGTGTTPAAVRAKKGATLGDVILPLASSVSRAGYIPRYWALPGQSTAAPFTYVLTSNLTLEMYWEPLDGVPYEIVYWVEKPNLGLNYSPRPGNASHYDYAYTETLGGSGYAGDLIGGPGIGADIEIKSIPAASFFDWEDPMHWAEWQFTEPTVLTGDGLTVVNVYCTLKTYRITFNIDPDGAGRTMTGDYDHDGEPETYGFASPYKLDYKFGDVVADRWPHPSMGWSFSDPGGLAYSYWIHPELAVSSGDWQTTRTDITAVMMPADANAAGYSLTLSWTDVTDSITMHYWGEQLPEQVSNPSLTRREYNGRTWVLLDDYTASIPPTTDFQSKAIPGFQAGTQGDFSDEVSTGSFPTAQDAQGKWHNYVNHYYRRLSNPFAYDNRGHGPAVASVSMQFGASLAALDAPMADQTGWHFKGWYADANGTLLYDFTGTMPSTDVTVFAKWESTDHQVTFLDHDGTALATDGSQQQGVQNGHTVNFTNLTIGGQRYVAWETNDAARGALVGWDYQPTPASPKQSFNADTAIYGDLTLYARWQTEGLVVAYHQPDGTLLEEDDGVGGQGYSNGVAAVVRDGTGVQCAGGTYFEGWRIDGTGAVYTPGSSFQVVGNPHFYPFCPELDSDLSDISYVASGKYVVSYLNGYGSVVLTQELDPGSVTAAPTDGELAAAGFSYAPDQLFEGEWTLSASPGAAFDFSTPINDHVILKPILYDSVTIYFETQGTPVDPLQVKKGVTLGSVTLPGFAAITRPGYDNPYWSLADPSQAVRDNVTAHAGNVLNDNLTLYTVWHAIPNGTEYHVVYWVERPNMGVQFTPTPGNPDHYMFGYAETAARMGTAGQTVGGPDDGADNVIGNLNGVVLTGPEDPLKWSQWQFTEKTTINGDGSTIVNVYARLKVYWFQFDLKTKAPSSGENTTLEYDADLDGVIDAAEVYTHYEANSKLAAEDIHALQVPYKFGEKLGKRWPHPDNGAVFHIDNVALPDFYYWKSPDNSLMAVASSGVWQTPRTEVTGAMMPVDPGQTEPLIIKAVTTNFVAYGYEQVKFRYWTQPTPEQAADSTLTRRTFHGQTWVMASAYSADIWFSWWVGAAFDFSPKALEGMTNVGRDWSATLTGPGDYEDSAEPVYDEDWVEMLTPYRNFYYARNPITLTYNMSGHGTQVPAATLAYGWSLASYDK